MGNSLLIIDARETYPCQSSSDICREKEKEAAGPGSRSPIPLGQSHLSSSYLDGRPYSNLSWDLLSSLSISFVFSNLALTLAGVWVARRPCP